MVEGTKQGSLFEDVEFCRIGEDQFMGGYMLLDSSCRTGMLGDFLPVENP